MRRQLGSLVVVLSVLAWAALGARAETPTRPVRLFDGSLDHFYTWLGAPKKGEKSYGKDNDPEKVFSVTRFREDGPPLLRVSGKVFGGIVTRKEYENYHLVVEFRWGPKTWPPREKAARDSGILLHCVGEDGAAGGVWMESIECQMIEGGTGDFILVGGKGRPSMTVRAEQRPTAGGKRKEPYFNPEAEPMKFTGGRINWFARDPDWKDVLGFRGQHDVERPVGEWNTLECVCDGDKITNILNGKVVNAGTNASHTRGKILLQSEGAEVHFRRIDLLPLKK